MEHGAVVKLDPAQIFLPLKSSLDYKEPPLTIMNWRRIIVAAKEGSADHPTAGNIVHNSAGCVG